MSVGKADKLFHEWAKQRLEIWLDAIADVLTKVGFEPETARRRSPAAITEI